MEGAVAGEVENAHTFTLQVHTHTVGVDGPLSFSDLPVLTTLGELKTKIKDRVSPISAEETHQRLIHRGRYLREDGATMKELFGEDEVGSLIPYSQA